MAIHNTCEETVEQRRSGLAVFLAAVLIALLAAASIGVLQQRSDRGRQGEILLAHLEGVTGALNALEWEAISRRQVTRVLNRRALGLYGEASELLVQATPIDRDGRTLPQVGNALIAYEDAVREELRLLESGKWEKARAYNEAQVNVRFKALDEAIQAADITFMAGATQAHIIASSGTTLVLFLAAALITGLLQRFERVQRRAGRLATEQSSLRRSEERFRSLVRNASDVIAILDSDAKIRYLSPAVERVWGQAASVLHGSSLLALVHPEDLARARTLLE